MIGKIFAASLHEKAELPAVQELKRLAASHLRLTQRPNTHSQANEDRNRACLFPFIQFA